MMKIRPLVAPPPLARQAEVWVEVRVFLALRPKTLLTRDLELLSPSSVGDTSNSFADWMLLPIKKGFTGFSKSTENHVLH